MRDCSSVTPTPAHPHQAQQNKRGKREVSASSSFLARSRQADAQVNPDSFGLLLHDPLHGSDLLFAPKLLLVPVSFVDGLVRQCRIEEKWRKPGNTVKSARGRHGREEQEGKAELDLVSDVGRCLLALEDVAQTAGEKGNDQAELSVLKHAPLICFPSPLSVQD